MQTEQTQPTETFEVIERSGHKIIISSLVLDHIRLHSKPGNGSCFKSGFEINLDLIPQEVTPGPNVVDFGETVGYELLDKYEYASQLQNADATFVTKESYAGGTRKEIKVPAFQTTQSIEDFKTNLMTVLLFPFNPDYASSEMKAYVKANGLEKALVFGTAFPGLLTVRGEEVKPVHLWEENQWAVILPTID